MKIGLRVGITLAEVLVVISMVGILVGLAMPALQNLREGSRSIECQKRLGVFVQGSFQYQEANNRMPPVTTGPGPVNDVGDGSAQSQAHQHTGAIAYILPFIGQQDIFDLMPSEATNPAINLVSPESSFFGFTDFLNDPGMLLAYNEQVESWICPSNAAYLDAQVEFLTFWSPVQFSQSEPFTSGFIFNVNSTSFGRSSYIPAMGGFKSPFESEERALDLSLEQASSAMRNRLDSIRSDELPDGATNTVCWAESVGWIDSADETPSGKPELIGANFALFGNAVTTGRAFLVNGLDEPPTVFGSAEGSANFLPGSMHPDGVPFAMCDGSVRMIQSQYIAASYGSTWLWRR